MHWLGELHGAAAASALADWASSDCGLMARMQMRGPCKWIWSHLNMHYSSLEMQTEMRLCCWPAFIGPCLLKLYSERSNKQERRGSGRVRRTIWESHTSVNKPKRQRVKKECFREWFQQILDPRVAYPWVICNRPPLSQGCVRGKEVIEWTSKKWDQQKYAVLIFHSCTHRYTHRMFRTRCEC